MVKTIFKRIVDSVWLGSLFGVAFLALLTLTVAPGLAPVRTHLLDVSGIHIEDGHAFVYGTGRINMGYSDTEGCLYSRAEMLEDGRPLGPAHAPHTAIRAQGGGAFSHWERQILFSSSDGSDPRSGAHRYAVRGPWLPPICATILIGMIAWLLNGRRWNRFVTRWIARPAIAVLFGVGALAIFGWAMAIRHPVGLPFADPDTWGYLHPVVKHLTCGELQVAGSRTFAYPLFLSSILRFAGDFSAITWVQLACSLLAGGLLLCVILWAGLPRNPRPVQRLVAGVFSLVTVYLFLLAPSVLFYERTLRPEAVTPMFMALLLLLAWLFLKRLLEGGRWTGILFAIVLTCCVIYFLKPNWGLTILCPFFLAVAGPGAGGVPRLMPRTLLATICFFLICFPVPHLVQKHLAHRYDRSLSVTFVPATLFSFHADIIFRELDKDLRAGRPVPFDRKLLVATHDLLARKLAESSGAVDTNAYGLAYGVSPLVLLYRPEGLSSIRTVLPTDPVQEAKFYSYYFRRAVMAHAWTYSRKVLRQLGYGYKPGAQVFRTYPVDENHSLTHSLKSLDGYRPMNALPSARTYLAETEQALKSGSPRLIQDPVACYGLRKLNQTHLAVLVFFLVCASWWLIGRWRNRDSVFGTDAVPLVLLTCFAYVCSFLTNLTTALMSSLGVKRYIEFHFTTSLAAEMLALLFIGVFLSRAVQCIRRRREGRLNRGH